MSVFRDIWNFIVTGDTSDFDRKVTSMGRTAEATGATVEGSFRNRMGSALGDFAQKIPGVSGLMEKFGVTSQQAGALMGTAVATGAVLAGEKVAEFAKHSVEEFQKQSQEVLHFKEVTDLSAESASKWVAVAGDYAVSAEDLSGALGKMDKAAFNTPEKFTALGIAIAKTKDGGFDAQQTFLNVVDAFNSTDDASKKAAIGAAAFGKGWQSVVKLLDVGSAEIKSSFAEVKDFQIFSDADLKKSEDYRHAMDDLNDAVKGFEREIGQALVPALVKGATELTHMVEEADKLGRVGGWVFDKVGADAGDFFKVLTNPGGAALDKVRDLGDAIGDFFGSGDDGKELAKGFDNVANSSNKTTASILQEAAAVAAHKEETDKAAESARIYMENNQGLRDSLDATREAHEKATQALKDYRDAAHDLLNEQLGLEGAMNSAKDAIDDYNTKVLDHTTTVKELRDANLDVRESWVSLGDQAVATATQQAQLHGATLDAKGALDAQVTSLQTLFANLSADSPLRKALDEYILSLYNIPGEIHTNVDITGEQWNIWKGREGNSAAGSTGGGDATPAAVVGAIKTYEASNGTGWRNGPR